MVNAESHFIDHLASELSLQNSEEVKPLVSSVLQAFRLTMPRKGAEALRTRLPEFLRGYWPANEKEEAVVHVEHLDELVTLVMERDKRSAKSLFRSEIQTLSVILFTLKKLFTLVDADGTGISKPLFREVREASAELAI